MENNRNREIINSIDLDAYLNMSSNDILVKIGSYAISDECFFSDSPSISDIYKAAISWFEQNYPNLKTTICNNKDILRCKKNEAIYTILDFYIGYNGFLPFVFASIYVVDYGLEKFCKSMKTNFIDSLSKHTSETKTNIYTK